MSNAMRDLSADELEGVSGGNLPAPRLPNVQPHFGTGGPPYNIITLKMEVYWLIWNNICMCGCGPGVCNMGDMGGD
jgi:hypothetical protein